MSFFLQQREITAIVGVVLMDSQTEKVTIERQYLKGMELLIGVVQKLSFARSLGAVIEIVRHSARELTGADGATFILRDKDLCFYVDEDAIEPLWKGKKFAINTCISGWSMLHHESVTIEDIYKDPRIPIDVYRPTFVKSLVMVPVRKDDPIAAIGTYWKRTRKASPQEVSLLQALADSTSIALENIQLYADLRKSLDETRAARDGLARQLNLRDEFISVSAHELKTPLTPLMIQIQFLQRIIKSDKFSEHPLKQELEKTTNNANYQVCEFSKRIDDLLDVSRIRLGQFTFNLQDGANFGEIVRKVVGEYELVAPKQIHLDISGKLTGTWDPWRLEQAIRNLVSNAVRYGEKRPINVSVHGNDENMEVKVMDHGFGIAKKDQERIFDRFERATSIMSYGGLGLGLFITRQIIRSHGGQIRVESEPGSGSTFIIELPRFPNP